MARGDNVAHAIPEAVDAMEKVFAAYMQGGRVACGAYLARFNTTSAEPPLEAGVGRLRLFHKGQDPVWFLKPDFMLLPALVCLVLA